MAAGPVFPAFLKLEHQNDGSAKASFLAEINSLTQTAEQKFRSSFDEIGRVVSGAFATMTRGGANLDLGTSGMRQAANEAELAKQKLVTMRDAARSLVDEYRMLGAEFGDVSNATKLYAQALGSQVEEADRAARQARAQADAYEALQSRVSSVAAQNEQLAASYRAIYAEQAKATNAAYQAQQSFNSNFPGMTGAPKSARDSASVFENYGYKPTVDMRSGVERLVAGDASLDRAAVAATTLEQVLGRVANKGREVQTTLDGAAAASARTAQEMATADAIAASEKERLAQSAANLRGQLDPTIAIQQRFDAEMARADDLMRAGAISTKEYAAAQAMARQNLQESWTAIAATNQAQTRAAKEGTTANHMMVNSMRAQRVAGIQLGQQMQDMVIQTQMGTSAVTIFTQQVPQMAFALSGLTESANRTLQRIGAFGTFLSGPWGTAIFAATAILGPFIAGMFDTGSAADEAKNKTYDFADGLRVLELSANETTNAMQQLAQEMRGAIAVQGDFLRSKALLAGQSVSDIESRIASNQAALSSLRRDGQGANMLNPFSTPDFSRMGELQAALDADRAALRAAQRAATDAQIATTQQRAIESLDPKARARGEFERSVGVLNQRLRATRSDPIGAQSSGQFLSDAEYEREFTRLQADFNKSQESTRTRRPKRDNSAREMRQLQEFGEKAAESIKRINERFNEQPRLVDQAAQATRELDNIIADLSERKPAGFEKLISEARDAQQVVQDALVRPFQELERDSGRRIQIQNLISQGREEEASALQTIWQLEERLGPLTKERKQQVLDVARAERQATEELEKAMEIQNAYLDATRSVRREVESILSGTGSLSNLKNVFRDLQGRVLTEQLFGDMFRDLDKYVKEQTGIGSSVDMLKSETERAGTAANAFADALNLATSKVTGQSNPLEQQFDTAFAGRTVAANDNGLGPDGEIVVKAQPDSRTLMGLNPQTYFSMMSTRMVGPLIDGLNQIFSTTFFNKFQGVLGSAIGGYLSGGATGGILGAIKGIEGLPAGLSKSLGKAMDGAATGSMIAGLGNMLGLKMSNTGAQIGGAIGSMIPIPGGQIIGSIIGGIAGKLFSSAKKASATITGGATGPSVSSFYSNNANQGAAATGMADNVIGALNKIADTLGGSATGSFAVSVGIRDKNYRVDTNGTRQTKGYGVVDFGADGEAAIAFAIADAIKDGAIIGLRATTLNILKTAKDIEAGLQKAVDFENVFRRLKGYTDPVGAALDGLDREFTNLKKTFMEAGASAAEFADLQKLYEIERQKTVEQAMEQVAGSLKSLLDQLTVGNDAYSLRDRQAMAMARYQPLAARVAAGDTSAYDAFSEAAQALLDIQRQMYGSQAEYFALLGEVTTLTKGQINAQTEIANAASGRDSPFASTLTTNDNQPIVDGLSVLGIKLDAVNDNLGALLAQGKLGFLNVYTSNGQGYF